VNTFIKIITGNKTVRKATAALGVTLLGGIGTSLIDGSLTAPELGMTVGAALVACAAVWKTSNAEA
jgi:hypothetical protein